MIEVNLSPREKQADITNVGGLNLSLLNIKMLIVAFIILYGIEPFLIDYFEKQLTEISAKTKVIVSKQREINKDLKALEHVKKQVEDLNRQEKALSQRINAVKVIVDKRQNPFKVFKYIAENTPDDVWIKELELDDRKLKMIGYSKSWKSIGEFLENLKSSIFFSPGISFDKPTGVASEYKGNRVEPFQITADVARFQ